LSVSQVQPMNTMEIYLSSRSWFWGIECYHIVYMLVPRNYLVYEFLFLIIHIKIAKPTKDMEQLYMLCLSQCVLSDNYFICMQLHDLVLNSKLFKLKENDPVTTVIKIFRMVIL
jgi:hypothetical protein